MRKYYEPVLKQKHDGRTIEVDYYKAGRRWFLFVNGREVGMSFNPKNVDEPTKWADRQLKTRAKVIKRNLDRLKEETARWEKERYELEI